MKVKKWTRIAAVLFACMYVWMAAAAAEVSGISVMSIHMIKGEPRAYFEVRAMDNKGDGLNIDESNFEFVAGTDRVKLTTNDVPSGNKGHIIVVDSSLYYYGNQNLKIENIRDIILSYLSRISGDERIMFVVATDSNVPNTTNYMSLDRARDYARGIEFGKDKSARINTAIYEAFQYAINPLEGSPMFNSVFVVADPDIENNKDNDHTLSECIQLRAQSGKNFNVTVAVPRRENFLRDTNDARRQALNSGFKKYEEFATQCGGKYIQIPQDNQGVDTNELHEVLTRWMNTEKYFTVDFSALSGHISTDPQVQNVEVMVTCEDNGGNAVRTVNVSLDTALLPPPSVTPEPVASVPTPTPAPTPVVVVGQADSVAMQAIYSLNQLEYLEKSNFKEFDNVCFIAYIDFCKNNGIEPRDGIYEDEYNLLIGGQASPAPRDTPEPTMTPMPTIPATGYVINDQDTEHSGGYIAQIQTILKKLNCYAEGASSNFGRMDQATIDAINVYCESFNWFNDRKDGVTQKICEEILTNGPSRTPLTPAEPTAQEKALAFLKSEFQIAGFKVKMWIPILMCGFLAFAILAIIILKSGKTKDTIPPSESDLPKYEPPVDAGKNSFSYKPEEEESTAAPYFSKFVTLNISYAGESWRKEIELKDGISYTIGRKECDLILDSRDKESSRRHAELIYRGNIVYVRDMSSYNNTKINGMQVSNRIGENGTIVNNGDEICLSQHRIIVKW